MCPSRSDALRCSEPPRTCIWLGSYELRKRTGDTGAVLLGSVRVGCGICGHCGRRLMPFRLSSSARYEDRILTSNQCPFCNLPSGRIVDRSAYGVVILDGFPISPGHTLVIPHRHIGSFFDLHDDERSDLLTLLDTAKRKLDTEFSPHGYNIGINDGPAAGQTVPHLHIHLIPRFTGDRVDPRGGVRWIIAEKADYWSQR